MTGRGAILAFILVIAFVLRLYAACIAPPPGALALQGDSRFYDELARNLAAGRGFVAETSRGVAPTAQMSGPLYPLFLGLVYWAAGPSHGPEVVRLIQVLLGVWVCWLVARLGHQLFTPTTGLWAAGLTSVYLPLIRHADYGGPAYLLSENLTIPLLTLSVCLLDQEVRTSSTSHAFIAGICLGFATMSRATLMAFPIAVAIWFWWLHPRQLGVVVRSLAIVGLGMAIVIGPWTWRNYRAFGSPVLLSTYGGIAFWYGNNSQARGGWVDLPIPQGSLGRQPIDELEVNRTGYEAGLQALWADPGRIPALVVRKVAVFWLPVPDTNVPEWDVNWMFIVVSSLAIVGWWTVRRQPIAWLPLVIPPAFLTAMAAAFFGDPRFRLPVEPLLLVLAGAGVVHLLSAVRPAAKTPSLLGW